MDKRTTGIIATIAATLLCGCPGLFGLCFGSIFAFVGAIPGAEIDMGGSNDPRSAIGFGLGAICLSLIGIAIPIAVGFFTLRQRPAPAAEAVITTIPSSPSLDTPLSIPAVPDEPAAEPPLPPITPEPPEEPEEPEEPIPPAI